MNECSAKENKRGHFEDLKTGLRKSKIYLKRIEHFQAACENIILCAEFYRNQPKLIWKANDSSSR